MEVQTISVVISSLVFLTAGLGILFRITYRRMAEIDERYTRDRREMYVEIGALKDGIQQMQLHMARGFVTPESITKEIKSAFIEWMLQADERFLLRRETDYIVDKISAKIGDKFTSKDELERHEAACPANKDLRLRMSEGAAPK
jgi:hypothetical protein